MSARHFVALLILLAPSVSFAANGALYMSPARGTYTMDQVFEVDVRADTDGEVANAAEADLSFNPHALTVEKISTDGSVLSLWPTQPEYSNTNGTVRFSGTASRNFTGKDAVLVRIMFRATSNLPGDVHIDSGALLADDARTTNMITSMRSGLYTIVAHQAPPLPDTVPAVATDTPIETPAVKGASIQVPTIAAYDDRVAVGGRIALQGTATPNTTISVFLQHDDDAPRESRVRANGDGAFTYVGSDLAQVGTYRAWAEARADSESFFSDKATIEVLSQGFAAAALGPVLTFTTALIALLIAAAGSCGYLYNRRAAQRAR